MKINVWGINYSPEQIGIAVYNTDLCNYLAERGAEVEMVTSFAYYPAWRKALQDRKILWRTDSLGSVKVHRCWHYVPARPSTATRILHECSFVISSFLRQLLLKSPDLYIVVSPPLLLGLAALVISYIKGAPFFFHVQDMQPDAALSLKMLTNRWLLKLLYAIEKLSYSKALAISGISLPMCNAIRRKGITQSKVIYFPNWIDIPDPSNLPEPGTWKKSRAISKETTIVSYAGNLGAKQGLDLILETAALMQNQQVLFVMAGDGAQRRRLEKVKEILSLTNVVFEPVLSQSEHSALLVDSDICLVVQQPSAGASFLPSKLLKILAYERPVVTNADSSSALREAISDGRFGICAPLADAPTLARTLTALLGDAQLRSDLGKAGRAYVVRFEKKKILQEFHNRICSYLRQN